MNKISAKDKWKTVIHRVMNQDCRMDMIVMNEWQQFSKLEIDLLLQLNNAEISFDSIKTQSDFLRTLQNGTIEFIEECLLTSMGVDQNQFNSKFLPLFTLIEEWIEDGILINCDREKILGSLLLHFIEKEDEQSIRLILSNTSEIFRNRINALADHNEQEEDTSVLSFCTEYPETNSGILIRACEKNNFHLIRDLILAGYR